MRGADTRPTISLQLITGNYRPFTNPNQYGLMHPDFIAPYIFENPTDHTDISELEQGVIHGAVTPVSYQLIIENDNY